MIDTGGQWVRIIADTLLVDPRSRPTVTASRDNCFCTCRSFVRMYVRTSVPTFQNKTNLKRKQSSLLARLWVRPSGSLMIPFLCCLIPSLVCYHPISLVWSGNYVLKSDDKIILTWLANDQKISVFI